MIKLKNIDLYGQLLIGAICLLIGIVLLNINYSILIYCLLVGCWQLVSAIVHLLFKNKLICLEVRKWYWITVVLYFLVFGFSFTHYASMLVVPVFYLGLIPAICYTAITYRELNIWENRDLIQLR